MEASPRPLQWAQGPSEQRPHKLSYHLTAKGEEAQKVISQLGEALQKAGVRGKIIYSGGMDVDILPEGASKGEGLKFLLRQVGSHISCVWWGSFAPRAVPSWA